MTTEHIEGLDGVEELLGRIAPRVTRRRAEVRREREGRRRHEVNLALGAAAAMKSSRDKREALDEEDDQLDDIERMAAAFVVAAEGDSVDTDVDDVYLYSREELEELPQDGEELAELAADYGLDPDDYPTWEEFYDALVDAQHAWCAENGYEDPNAEEFEDEETPETTDEPDLFTEDDLRRMSFEDLWEIANWYSHYQEGHDLEGRFTQPELVDYILDAQHEWCVAYEVEDPNQDLYLDGAPPRRRFPVHMDVRNWSAWQWVLAVICGFIALVIALNTWEPLFEDIDGSGRGLLSTFWVVGLTGFGFFFGGYIGSNFDPDED